MIMLQLWQLAPVVISDLFILHSGSIYD